MSDSQKEIEPGEVNKLVYKKTTVKERKDIVLRLINTLEKWTEELKIDRLGKYGITSEDIEKIVKKASLKNNPVNLIKEDIETIVINRI